MPANTAICKSASPAPLRFEEKFRAHLNLTDGSPVAKVLTDSRILIEVAGLLQAFLSRPTAQAADVLERQRQRGRRRRQALPRAVNALLKAAGCYRDLLGLEGIRSGFADAMEQEAFRLLQQKNAWDEFHNEKRLGFKHWIFLVILQEFLKFAADYRVTVPDLVRLQTAGERALGRHASNSCYLPVADDLRGLEHLRANPRNQALCNLASFYAASRASRLQAQPFPVFRNET